MMYLMRTSGAETLSAAANVFMGQTEAPIIVKPYVPRMTQSELLAMMVGGHGDDLRRRDGGLHQPRRRPASRS